MRDELFQQFIDIRTALKGRFPRAFLKALASEIHREWLKRTPDATEEEKNMKFTNRWIKGWCEEYYVSLKSPNKRFSVSQEDRVERDLEHLKNILRFRVFFMKKFGVDPPIINGDQMPLHRNEVR